MPGPLAFEPIYQERVWGGDRLATSLGRTLPPGNPIGESWEIVDRPEANSRVAAGPHAGLTLRALLEKHGAEILGDAAAGRRPFPILVKWLDCRERLSLQVHPPARVAAQLKGEPKTENWFIAEADPGASLIVGLRRGVTREAFIAALEVGRLEPCLHTFPVSAGQSLLVESGRLHAIDAGNLILEIQQNSDTTYRVYDWGRKGLDGQSRQLHVEESLASIDFADVEPAPLTPAASGTVLADCPEFRLRWFRLAPGEAGLPLPAGEGPRLLHVVGGSVDPGSGAPLRRGTNVLLPASEAFSVTAADDCPAEFLLTDRFLP
ncbi:MAG: mannose-6-phosphate isomerase [Puniceicoccaceae bacterium]|nr:MAG: mannose-6-phosphate isomerase [Puniceicoccaceae bacterium]